MSVRLESYQIRRWAPLTYGFAVTAIKTIPIFLKAYINFQEAFFQILSPGNRVCGTVGIFIRGDLDTLATVDEPDLGRVQTS